jgi:hypothetical protein
LAVALNVWGQRVSSLLQVAQQALEVLLKEKIQELFSLVLEIHVQQRE